MWSIVAKCWSVAWLLSGPTSLKLRRQSFLHLENQKMGPQIDKHGIWMIWTTKTEVFFWVFCTTKTGIWSGWSFLYHVFVCCLNGCPGRFTYWRSGIQMLLCGKPMMRQSGKRNGKDMVRIWTWTFVFVSYQTDRLTDNIIQYTHDLEVDLHLLIIQV